MGTAFAGNRNNWTLFNFLILMVLRNLLPFLRICTEIQLL